MLTGTVQKNNRSRIGASYSSNKGFEFVRVSEQPPCFAPVPDANLYINHRVTYIIGSLSNE